jgi:hypothetical protein
MTDSQDLRTVQAQRAHSRVVGRLVSRLARFDWPGGPGWGWDGLVTGERAVLRILPEHGAAVAFLSNADRGRALYGRCSPKVMAAEFGIQVPPLRLTPAPGAVATLPGTPACNAWPDQRVEVTAQADHLRIKDTDQTLLAQPIDDRTFLVDHRRSRQPHVTFADFDEAGRPHVLYLMVWALPRQVGQHPR